MDQAVGSVSAFILTPDFGLLTSHFVVAADAGRNSVIWPAMADAATV